MVSTITKAAAQQAEKAPPTQPEKATKPEKPPSTKPAAFVKKQRPAVRGQAAAIGQQLANLKAKALQLPEVPTVAMGPALVAVFGSRNRISFLNLYALALLGASAGFYLFLYFISIGYAASITLPVLFCLVRLQWTQATLRPGSLVHSWLVVAWGVRAVVFYWWREHRSWPALHDKIVAVERTAPTLAVKLVCWLWYSAVYTCMLAPCWFRLEADAAGRAPHRRLVGVSRLGIVLQVIGLVLETTADWQKSIFKASARHEWCHVGIWKWSTHPNYLGEWVFWLGTLVGSLDSLSNGVQLILGILGFIFISSVLRGAAEYLTRKHFEKYGELLEFVEFRKRFTVVGPRWWERLGPAVTATKALPEPEPSEANAAHDSVS